MDTNSQTYIHWTSNGEYTMRTWQTGSARPEFPKRGNTAFDGVLLAADVSSSRKRKAGRSLEAMRSAHDTLYRELRGGDPMPSLDGLGTVLKYESKTIATAYHNIIKAN